MCITTKTQRRQGVNAHVSSILLGVEDMDRSKQFYTEGLGCLRQARNSPPWSDEKWRRIARIFLADFVEIPACLKEAIGASKASVDEPT
jgi:catechol 2,3-dioxygenase-like lactoylglutathione lyase family enzyme